MDTTTYRYHSAQESIIEDKEMVALMYRYHIVEEYIFNPEIGKYRTYGIKLTASDGTTDYISDVSVSKLETKRMVDYFNRYQLSSIHFQEAVENML